LEGVESLSMPDDPGSPMNEAIRYLAARGSPGEAGATGPGSPVSPPTPGSPGSLLPTSLGEEFVTAVAQKGRFSSHVEHGLCLRRRLGHHAILNLFYPSLSVTGGGSGRFRRARGREFLGLSYQEGDAFFAPFWFGQIADPMIGGEAVTN